MQLAVTSLPLEELPLQLVGLLLPQEELPLQLKELPLQLEELPLRQLGLQLHLFGVSALADLPLQLSGLQSSIGYNTQEKVKISLRYLEMS